IHQREIVGEIRHARIVDLVAQATDVQLRKMMIAWLLQGSPPSLTNVMNSRRLCSPKATTAPYHVMTVVCCTWPRGGSMHTPPPVVGRIGGSSPPLITPRQYREVRRGRAP